MAIESNFFLTGDGVRLHYLDSGAGRVLIFVPGWTMPAEIWLHQLENLAHDYRVIALDPRSQGLSEKTSEGNHFERRAQDINDLIIHLGCKMPVLIGWSMGAGDVLTYAQCFGTASICGVVLVDICIRRPAELEASAKQRAHDIQTHRYECTERYVRGMFKTNQPDQYIGMLISAALKTPTNTAIALMANHLWRSDWSSAIREIRKPILYICSADLRAQSSLLHSIIPTADLAHFAEGGHALFVDQPDQFESVIRNFVELRLQKLPRKWIEGL
jgi:non-heme chloroperoxidase